MNGWRVAVGLLLLVFAPALMGAAADQPSSQDILKSKGLTRVGIVYELDGDIHLSDILRPMRAAKHDMESAEKEKAAIQDEIRSDEDQLADWAAQRDRIGEDMAKTSKKSANYNQFVVEFNAMTDKVSRGVTEIERRQEAANAVKIPQAAYFDAQAKFIASFESTSADYDKLAADADVIAALKSINSGARFPARLGPSAAFQQEMPEFRKLKAETTAGIIKLNVQANVAMVNVTINGVEDVDMIVDSGASMVVLSTTVADRLGIKLNKTDRIIRSTIANGQSVETHLITVKSIRLGPFTVENVICGIQPGSKKDSDCLLGGTFLQNFAYQMDLTNGELRLSQISGRPADNKKQSAVANAPPGSPSTAGPSTKPSSVLPLGGNSPAVPGPLGKPLALTVHAATGWTPTDVKLVEGKCYQITVAGRWTNVSGQDCGGEGVCPAQWLSPLGPLPPISSDQRKSWYIDQNPRSSLMARVDRSKPGFFVGSGAKFVAPVSGTLEFAMNDGDQESPTRTGSLTVTIAEIKPHWIEAGGDVEIDARIDVSDFLHITPSGLYWEWGGRGGKVGEHSGHYPTIVNGIFWWPKWVDKTTTAPQAMPGLDPALKVKIKRVVGKRGDVEVTESSPTDVALHFTKVGQNSHEVGCELEFAKP